MQKKFVFISITILVLLGMAGVIYYHEVRTTSLSQQPTPSQTVSPTVNKIADWKIYTNTSYRYSIQYPADQHVLNVLDESYATNTMRS